MATKSGRILSARYAAASNIFSIKIPYPVEGSLTRTWVMAPTSFPVAVPGVRLADGAAALHTDRSHSLSSLFPPPAAVASLPVLDNRTAAHADVKYRTKEFCVFLWFLCVFAGKRQVFTHLNRSP